MDVSSFPTSQAGETRTETYTTGRQLSDQAGQGAADGSGARSSPKWPAPTQGKEGSKVALRRFLSTS